MIQIKSHAQKVLKKLNVVSVGDLPSVASFPPSSPLAPSSSSSADDDDDEAAAAALVDEPAEGGGKAKVVVHC